ncbi:hypothetical protein FS749_010016 [Ceratobasidium sp. UAMH 11750]|nr:hypothetical protein FS749_010016 [Ceratobasidium sp. UAMH 11750]
MAAPSLSTSTDMGFRGYEFVDAFTIPHAHYVHALSVSPGGRWVLSSSSGPAGNAIVIADSRNLSQHGHYTFPSKWITCVSWVSDDLFFAGFSDGTTYVGKIEGGEENAGYFEFALDLTPIRIAGLSSQGPITAITHHALGGGYLAVANARQIVLARGSRNPDSTNNLNFVGLEPFEDPRSSITGLLFSSHGAGGLKLIVCATGGFM